MCKRGYCLKQYLEGTCYRLFDLAPHEHFYIPTQDFATTPKTEIRRFNEGFLRSLRFCPFRKIAMPVELTQRIVVFGGTGPRPQ